MQQFDLYSSVHPDWFASMHTNENGEPIEEEWFGFSVVDTESM